MADALVKTESAPIRMRNYVVDSIAELKRVTWPDQAQVRSLSVGVVILALAIGALIAIIDLILQAVLVRGIPSLFGA